jgi:hypothetical protein
VRSSESPGFRADRQPPHPLGAHDHVPYVAHHHTPAHHSEEDQRSNNSARLHGMGHMTNAVPATTGPPYSIPVPMAMAEMDSLNREHQQSVHGQRH